MGRVAFVGESMGCGEWTGRWSAHWADGDDHEPGPREVSLDEALTWGRAHAELVLVRPGDSSTYYSAGARPAPDHPPWSDTLDLGPRPTLAEVPAGGATVAFSLRHGFRAPVADLHSLAETYAAAIDPSCTLEPPAVENETVSGVITVTAGSRPEALRAAGEILGEARRQVGRRLAGVGWTAFLSADG